MTMDTKERVRKAVHYLNPEEFLKLMTDLHFDYPLRTKDVTDQIVRGLKSVPSIKSEEFLQMIEERKAEYNQEVREKRERDRQRIQDVKSRSGLDPIDIFPKEIWKKILGDVLPEDKRNFREVHHFYRTLTEDNLYSDILLPLTMTPLVRKICGIQQGGGGQYLSRPEVRWPKFLSTLRLVSKSLRNAVDLWFENDLLFALRNNVNGQPCCMIDVDLKQEDEHEKIKKMSNLYETSSSAKRPRFFTRALDFFLCEYENEEESSENGKKKMAEFLENINTVLDHIGPQIWFFNFSYYCPAKVESSIPKFAERYQSLQGWLKRMPNLKWLKISIDQNENDEEEEMDLSWRLGDYFKLPEKSSLPPLPHLERLDLKLDKPIKYALPVFKKFLNAYSHVKLLNMFGIKSAMMNGIVLMPEPLRTSFALECLRCFDGPDIPRDPLRMFFADTEDKDEAEEKKFKAEVINALNGTGDADVSRKLIFHMNWPLKQLKLEMKMHDQSIYCLFRSLENLPTLENLSLDVKNATIKDDISSLKLPNLKSFQLKFEKLKMELFEQEINWSFFFSLQYLLKVKKLQSLKWKCDMAEDVLEKAKQDVVNMEKEMREGEVLNFGDVMWGISLEDSNIWRAFPWLVRVETERVTRAEEGHRRGHGEQEVLNVVKKKYRRNEVEKEECNEEEDEEECEDDEEDDNDDDKE